MWRLAIVVVGLSGVALADKPLTDRAVKALKLAKEMSTKDLCVIQRTQSIDGSSSIDLTYAVDGRVTRRERWTRESAKATPMLDTGETYAWTGRELTVTIQPGRHRGVRRYRYDQAGLLVHYESEPDKADTYRTASTSDLTWDLTKLDKRIPLYRPLSTNPAALDLPRQLGSTGFATLTRTGSTTTATITYGANGSFERLGCKLDARGRELTCGNDEKFQWAGSQLVAHWSEIDDNGKPAILWRAQYRYDKQNRLMRAQGERGTNEGLAVAWLATLEYRCSGIEGYREPD